MAFYIPLHLLAGKMLQWLAGNLYVFGHNFNINSGVMKIAAEQVLRCSPFLHIKSCQKNPVHCAISIKYQMLIFSFIELCTNIVMQEVQPLQVALL